MGADSDFARLVMDMAQTIALSAGLAWASGLRLYLVVFLAGALSYFGYLQLPATLSILHNPLVIGTAGILAFAELIADKAFKERRSISMTEVAEGSGVHRATLSKMANQPGPNVGTEIVDKLCRYFTCQAGDLLMYVDDEEY